jgi:hypothetical protein
MPATMVRRGSAVAANVEYVDNGDIRPGWLSADGATVYSWGPSLRISKDDAHTWIATNFAVPSGSHVHGIRETADGELLISCFKAQGFYAGLWRSTGWNITTGQASAWTEVLTPSGQAPNVTDPATFPAPAGTTGDRSNYFTSWFGFRTYSNGIAIVNEYGKQANGTSIPGARYTFVSYDNGKPGTWSLLRDVFTGPVYGFSDWTPTTNLPFGPPGGGQHLHGSWYDPYKDRFWFTAGDHGHHTEYSDDHGATWHLTAGSVVEFGGQGGQPGTTQDVLGYALPSCNLLTTDGPIDGVAKIDRTAPNQADFIAMLHDIGLPHTTQLKYTGATPFQRSPAHPVLFPFYAGAGGGSQSTPGVIVAVEPSGQRAYDIWTDSQALLNPYGVFTAVGPTAHGKLLASIALDGRSAGQSATAGYTMLRADFPVIV